MQIAQGGRGGVLEDVQIRVILQASDAIATWHDWHGEQAKQKAATMFHVPYMRRS